MNFTETGVIALRTALIPLARGITPLETGMMPLRRGMMPPARGDTTERRGGAYEPGGMRPLARGLAAVPGGIAPAGSRNSRARSLTNEVPGPGAGPPRPCPAIHEGPARGGGPALPASEETAYALFSHWGLLYNEAPASPPTATTGSASS